MSNKAAFRNLSQLFNELSCKTRGIFREVGDNVVDIFEEEFEQLVMETPQRSGTTAASWKISLAGAGAGPPKVNTQPPKTRGEALLKGHMHAVSISLKENKPNFADMRKRLSVEFARSAITIDNASPGATQSEEGPVISGNAPAHALDRYVVRVADKIESSPLVDPNYFSRYNKC